MGSPCARGPAGARGQRLVPAKGAPCQHDGGPAQGSRSPSSRLRPGGLSSLWGGPQRGRGSPGAPNSPAHRREAPRGAERGLPPCSLGSASPALRMGSVLNDSTGFVLGRRPGVGVGGPGVTGTPFYKVVTGAIAQGTTSIGTWPGASRRKLPDLNLLQLPVPAGAPRALCYTLRSAEKDEPRRDQPLPLRDKANLNT